MITAQRHGFSGRASRAPPPEEASNDWTVARQTACLQEHPTAANPRAMRTFLTVTRHPRALLGCPKVESIRPVYRPRRVRLILVDARAIRLLDQLETWLHRGRSSVPA